ncbi:DUF2141 domain-containing protein [Neptuniibacter sp.]|uniref:DUF2141 domain-containing protein n=1 Tax=Neptuniibacter sp. TaxID=1962643 RepID=UPI00261A2200|nr:DUF2141 domain-containing protein [Neptuniibacter sp.]MCP4596279.1 DUF2141 domain-containing protein [Neptuniibacter sp.]
MIRAILYASLICAVMTLGLVALDLHTAKAEPFSDAVQELPGGEKQATNRSAALKTGNDLEAKPSESQVSKRAEHVSVTAVIKGLRNSRGQIIAQLFDQPDAFNNERYDQGIQTIIKSAENFTGELHFSQLPPGEYALVMFHDENSNHQFDQTGTAIEGYSFSNNVGKMAPANFSQAAFRVAEDKILIINLIYH